MLRGFRQTFWTVVLLTLLSVGVIPAFLYAQNATPTDTVSASSESPGVTVTVTIPTENLSPPPVVEAASAPTNQHQGIIQAGWRSWNQETSSNESEAIDE